MLYRCANHRRKRKVATTVLIRNLSRRYVLAKHDRACKQRKGEKKGKTKMERGHGNLRWFVHVTA